MVPAVRCFLDFLAEYTNGEGLPRLRNTASHV
jgi:hypothetical protein